MRSQLIAHNTLVGSSKVLTRTALGVRREARRHLGLVRRTGRVRAGRAHNPNGGGRFELDSGVRAIEDRIQSLSLDDLLGRYHELVDRRFTGPLGLIESFELDRVEARLSLEDQKEAKRIAAAHREWRREEDDLIRSIEDLLARLKSSSPRATF